MRRVVSVLGVVFVISSCSGSSKATSVPDTSKRTPSDTILAKRAVLQLRDLPDGYAELRTPTVSSDRSAEEKVLACLGLPDARGRAGRVEIRGRVFQQVLNSTHAREVGSGVVIEPSAADLERPFRVLASNRASPCLETYLRSKFTSDPRVARLHPRGLTVRPSPIAAIGDQRAGFDALVTFSTAGHSIDVKFNVFYVRRGRAMAELVAVGIGTVFPSEQASSLLETIVGRLHAAT